MQEEIEDINEKTTSGGLLDRVAGQCLRVLRGWTGLSSRSRAAVFLFLTCLIIYTVIMLVFPQYNGAPLTQGDEPHYLMINESILRDFDLELTNNYKAEQYRPYFDQDIELWHIAKVNEDRFVSTHPMFLSLLVLPAFRLFGYRGAAFTMILFTALAAAFTFLIADRFTRRAVAMTVTLVLFMTYPVLLYSRLIYPETVGLFLIALATWSGWRLMVSGRTVHAVVGGLCAGILMLLHPKFFPLSIALFILFLIVRPTKDMRLLAAWLIPASACIALLLVLTGITYGPNLLKGLTASGGSKFQGGFWGTNSVWGIAGMYLDRAWGLFIFAPVYLLFPLGLSLQNNRFEWDNWWKYFLVCIVLQTLFMGTFQSWNGGAAPAQRYVLPLVPLFTVCIALFLDRCRSKTAWGFASAFALLQLITTVWAFRFIVGTYGMENYGNNIFLPHFLNNNVVTRILLFVFPVFHPAGEWSIVLSICWILLYAGAIYLSRRYYLLHGGGKLSPVIDIRPFKLVSDET
ncbi:MAG: hypothetical protein JXA49_01260 [Actinobacteria bacterium]|nr:hypothetical protein [Actinomycetota bacterium]